MQSLYVVYLDRHHLGDDLFLKSLAQHLSDAEAEAPACVLVHGSGEKVERTLEAQGYFPDRTNGVLNVENEDQRRLVERAVREVNQELVAMLTDEVVSTVGIQGVDRGLFQKSHDDAIRASNAGWVSALLKQHVVPVVSALVKDPDTDRVQEVWPVTAVAALSRALDDSFDPVACMFTMEDRPGLPDEDGEVRTDAPVEAATAEHVPEPSAVRHVVQSEVPMIVTSPRGLFGGHDVEGTRIQS
jgi:acetylglutamate kinase